MRACVRAGGRRAALAASLGTYKPRGRICLRCQLKAFSNVHPTPSPGTGEVRGFRNPILPPARQPPAWPGGTAGACTTLVPGPASPLVGLKLQREGGSCLTSPSLGEGQESCPFQATIL